mmetsp:Transcript_27213/g.57242  ORF Transcript_27213/g.57242 Transcript_27213/m.57242 type:complete len:413 (+) Transcript_27213:1810-3048(+)
MNPQSQKSRLRLRQLDLRLETAVLSSRVPRVPQPLGNHGGNAPHRLHDVIDRLGNIAFGIDVMIDDGDSFFGVGQEYFGGSESVSSLGVDESHSLESSVWTLWVAVVVVVVVVVVVFEIGIGKSGKGFQRSNGKEVFVQREESLDVGMGSAGQYDVGGQRSVDDSFASCIFVVVFVFVFVCFFDIVVVFVFFLLVFVVNPQRPQFGQSDGRCQGIEIGRDVSANDVVGFSPLFVDAGRGLFFHDGGRAGDGGDDGGGRMDGRDGGVGRVVLAEFRWVILRRRKGRTGAGAGARSMAFVLTTSVLVLVVAVAVVVVAVAIAKAVFGPPPLFRRVLRNSHALLDKIHQLVDHVVAIRFIPFSLFLSSRDFLKEPVEVLLLEVVVEEGAVVVVVVVVRMAAVVAAGKPRRGCLGN